MYSMVKTKELYYTDAYMAEFKAKVISCDKGRDGNFFVILDQTAFFPEQGGQSSDIGKISYKDRTLNVLHTSIEEGIITHVTDAEIPVGEEVFGAIDYGHRFSNMQQHTGEHIFSGIVHSKFGYENVGFHLSDSEVTMDYNGPVSEADIAEIELLVNRAIWENVPVRCEIPSEEELSGITYRSKKELSGNIRIVTVEGYDVCACCAPHVKRTGEIGILKVVKCQSYKGGVRVSILCGERALQYLNEQQRIVNDLVGLLTTGSDKITDSVKRMSDDIYYLKGEVNSLTSRLLDIEIGNIDDDNEDVFLIKEPGIDGNVMREGANKLAARHRGYCGVFAGSDTQGYKYVIVSGGNKKDATIIQNLLNESFGARGGGKSAMVQGSIQKAAIADVLKALKDKGQV